MAGLTTKGSIPSDYKFNAVPPKYRGMDNPPRYPGLPSEQPDTSKSWLDKANEYLEEKNREIWSQKEINENDGFWERISKNIHNSFAYKPTEGLSGWDLFITEMHNWAISEYCPLGWNPYESSKGLFA